MASKLKISSISKISLAFINRFRITLLLVMAVLFLGYVSYTTLLKREGFPTIEIPIVIVQTPYFVNDIEKVNKDITTPIEEIIKAIPEVEEISSTTTENFSVIIASLNADTNSKEGEKLIREKVEGEMLYPENVSSIFQILDASSVNGKHNMLFTISNEKLSIKELQEKAEVIATALEKNNIILSANSIDLITKEINPISGEEFDYQKSINRVGIRKRGEINFYPAISIGVVKKEQYDAIELSNAVKEEIEILKEDNIINNDYLIEYTSDISENVRDQIDSLESNAVSGLIAVIIILFFFVNWRASIIVGIFIPTVMAASFILLYIIGYSLNVISLFALILVLGLLVDDAIVIVEAIDYEKSNGTKGKLAIVNAINSVGLGDIAGTLTTLLVFLPMAFISGVLGEFIRLIPITVIITLILSLIIALTVVPLFSNILLRGSRTKQGGVFNTITHFVFYGFSDFIGAIGKFFGNIVNTYLKYPLIALLVVIPISIALIWTGIYYAGKLTFSIFPSPKDTDELTIDIQIRDNKDILVIEKVAKEVESIVKNETEDYLKRVSYYEASADKVTLLLKLTKVGTREETSKDIAEKLQSELDDIEGAKITTSQVGVGPQSDEYQFAMQIYSEESEKLRVGTEKIQQFLEENKDLSGNASITEVVVTDLSTISKTDGKRYSQVKAKLSDTENTGLVLEVQEKIENEFDTNQLSELGLSNDSLGFDLGQESENMESFESAGVALVTALIVMYALLVLQFNSFSQPLLIFLAIPLSFPGLFLGLYYTNNSLGFLVSIGVMALLGIVVNNTIMLIEYANQARLENRGIKYAISKAVELRFRPIITTSATTIAGLLPLAISDPFWEGLSYSIIFGLVSSSLLVLLVFPAYYGLFEYLRYVRNLFIYIMKNSKGTDEAFTYTGKLIKYIITTLFGVKYT